MLYGITLAFLPLGVLCSQQLLQTKISKMVDALAKKQADGKKITTKEGIAVYKALHNEQDNFLKMRKWPDQPKGLTLAEQPKEIAAIMKKWDGIKTKFRKDNYRLIKNADEKNAAKPEQFLNGVIPFGWVKGPPIAASPGYLWGTYAVKGVPKRDPMNLLPGGKFRKKFDRWNATEAQDRLYNLIVEPKNGASQCSANKAKYKADFDNAAKLELFHKDEFQDDQARTLFVIFVWDVADDFVAIKDVGASPKDKSAELKRIKSHMVKLLNEKPVKGVSHDRFPKSVQEIFNAYKKSGGEVPKPAADVIPVAEQDPGASGKLTDPTDGDGEDENTKSDDTLFTTTNIIIGGVVLAVIVGVVAALLVCMGGDKPSRSRSPDLEAGLAGP